MGNKVTYQKGKPISESISISEGMVYPISKKLSISISKRFKDFKKNSALLFMALPAMILVLIFNYIPMLGIIVAFKNFRYDKGFWGSEWVGLENFKFFFTSLDAWRITRNTVCLNALFFSTGLIVSVALALMLHEITKKAFVKFCQTAYFFPYFLSWVVVGYTLFAFLNMRLGILNSLFKIIGLQPVHWYLKPEYWPAILVLVYLWKTVGYFSVIYYAGLMGIDPAYYEAAAIDGATRWQMITKISIPLITPLMVIIMLLQIGRIFYADFGMFYQLPRDIGMLYPTTDVIDTYVFRALRVTADIGMSAAAGFYQAIVGLILIGTANYLVRRINPENALF